MNQRLVWPAVSLASIGMIVACVMAVANVETATIIVIVSLMITPVLGALLAGQVAEIKGTTAQVVEQTNGHTTQLLHMVEEHTRMLAAAMPVRPPEPRPVEAPGGPAAD